MEHLMTLATVFLMLFGAVAAFDGVYYHFWKYQLHARPESWYEHKVHTAFAFLLVPVVFLLFYRDFGGLALWAGVVFVLIGFGAELLDVFSEHDSRASLGGLSSGEYAVHVLATILRVAAFTFALAAKPAAAWHFSAPLVLSEGNEFASSVAGQMIVGNLIAGALHIWLLRSGYVPSRATAPTPCCAGSAC